MSERWDFLPLNVDLRGRVCVVVGETAEARRKSELLGRVGARVEPCRVDELSARLAGERPALVVAASGDASADAEVAAAARAGGILVNVVSHPELSDFIFPSIIDRHPVLVAISSGGDAPVLTRLLRNRLEAVIPQGVGRLARIAGRLREPVKRRFERPNQRRRFWEAAFESQLAELAYAGDEASAEAQLRDLLDSGREPFAGGEVYLVGAGPGDPDLLTFRALRLMRQADVVLYDRLVSPAILDLVRRDAERIYVGKARADHAVPQPEINQRLVDLALEGKRVLRLKGGDPFIFGRGGEEIDLLAERGIPFQVVPGITAAAGCAAYAGIPLTHRDYAQSVRFVTGHLKDGSTDLPWPDLVQAGQTLVFYMGLVGLPQIAEALQSHGMAADMPVAVVSRGTLPDQRVVTGTLSDIPERVVAASLPGPTIIIVGEVVRLRERLDWLSRGIPSR